MSEESGSSYVSGILTGLLLGAVTALLLAPRRGKELRHELAEGASKLKDKAGDLGGTVAGTVAETARDLKERSGELVASVHPQGNDALQEATYYAEDVKDEIKANEQDIAESNGDKTHDIVDSV